MSPDASRTVYLNDDQLSRRHGLQNEDLASLNKYEQEGRYSPPQPQRVTSNQSGSNDGDQRKPSRGNKTADGYTGSENKGDNKLNE